MSIFTSQFDGARQLSQAYAGDTHETRFWTPAAITVAAGVGIAALVAVDSASDTDLDDGTLTGPDDSHASAAGWGDGWGDGWDTGWDTLDAAQPATAEGTDPNGEAWAHRGDYTDASVGGDGDFFYFIDGDTSLTIG
jgi:hypothetical protein